MTKKIFGLLFAFALLAALPTAAQDAETGGGGTLIGAFDVGPGGAPEVRPYMDTAGRTWLHKIWTPLVSWNSDQSAVSPQLATEWAANDDFTLWTFTLREGVTWHDGEPFTADDVVFSLNLALDPAAAVQYPSFSQFPAENFVEARAVDDLTVEMEFSAPAPRLEFALIMLWILPEHALADLDPADYQTTDWFFTEAIGTGPFMHDEYQPDQFWALVPNPDYWEGAPRLDRLINRYFEDETAAILALESGDIDFTYTSGDVALRLQDAGGYQTFSGPSGVTNYFTFNLRNPAFQDVRVRQAFLYSIDRDAIVETVFQGTHEVVPCISPFPSMWPEESELIDYSYNPERAQELLEEAGYDTGNAFEVVTYYSSQFALDAMAAQQAFLSQVGIDVTPLAQDVPTYNSYYYSGEGWDISYRGVLATVGNFPFNFYQPGGFPDLPEDETLIGEQFPELLELINAARVEGDFDNYLSLLQEICTFQNQNALEGYMWTSTRFGTGSDRLVDFYWFPAGGGGPYVDNAHLWSVSD